MTKYWYAEVKFRDSIVAIIDSSKNPKNISDLCNRLVVAELITEYRVISYLGILDRNAFGSQLDAGFILVDALKVRESAIN